MKCGGRSIHPYMYGISHHLYIFIDGYVSLIYMSQEYRVKIQVSGIFILILLTFAVSVCSAVHNGNRILYHNSSPSAAWYDIMQSLHIWALHSDCAIHCHLYPSHPHKIKQQQIECSVLTVLLRVEDY